MALATYLRQNLHIWIILDMMYKLSVDVVDSFKYKHNWPLQPFSQDYGIASHTTYVVCVNFIHKWWDLQFTVDSERQIFEKHFHGMYV